MMEEKNIIRKSKTLTDEDLKVIRARTIEEDKFRPSVRQASYDSDSAQLMLKLSNGVETMIPIRLIEGLQDADETALRGIEVSASGHALNWAGLDIQMSVDDLLVGVFGTPRWMKSLAAEWARSNGRKGGRAKSGAKCAAARANGRKGGRPRKQKTSAMQHTR